MNKTNNSLFENVFSEIQNKCCFSIKDNEKVLIQNFIKKLIYTYINASIKITKHCKKKIIGLNDIKLADEFINDETILVSTEVNQHTNNDIDKIKRKEKENKKDDLEIKSINYNFTKNISKQLIKNIDKNININDNAIKFLNNIILKFSKSFFNQCNNHCKIKRETEKIKKPELSSNDIYYILIH